MNINNINSDNYSEKDIKKARKSQASHSQKAGRAAASDSTEKVHGDRFSPSHTELNGEFDLAKNELKKLETDSFSALRKIRKKIAQGEYNHKEVHQKISSLVEKDLTSIEQVISSISEPGNSSTSRTSLSAEYKKYLIENPKVIQKVADQVAIDIDKL